MGFIDLIRELRTGEPNLKKAAKAMKFFGWGCLFGGLWNYILPQVAPFKETGFRLPTYYPILTLIGFSIIGALFLVSARGILEMESWGKKSGQAAITLLLVGIFLFSAQIMSEFAQFASSDDSFKIIFYIFFAIALAQFGLPVYFGCRYLGRLPTKDDPYRTVHYTPNEISRSLSEKMSEGATTPHSEIKYKNSPFPLE
jgi:hypothetical protein